VRQRGGSKDGVQETHNAGAGMPSGGGGGGDGVSWDKYANGVYVPEMGRGDKGVIAMGWARGGWLSALVSTV